MTEYVATCHADKSDTITARIEDESVELRAERMGTHKMEAYLHTADARTFARGILALADEIDGGEVAEEQSVSSLPVQPGDRIRILVENAEFAEVQRGDVFTVHSVSGPMVTVDDNGGGLWYFRDSESWEKVDKPAESVDVPITSTFSAHVDEAKRLLNGTIFRGTDVIDLARELADRS